MEVRDLRPATRTIRRNDILQTDGSIISPAQSSNVMSVAPTVCLVARDGTIPLSNRQDTVGPLARTVKSAAQLLTTIAGRSSHDSATNSVPFESIPDYAKACEGVRLDGIRNGVPGDAITDTDEVVMKEFEQVLKHLESAGAIIVNGVKFTGAKERDEWDSAEKRAYLQAEFKHSIEGWLGDLVETPRKLHCLSDINVFLKSDPQKCYPERETARSFRDRPVYHMDARRVRWRVFRWDFKVLWLQIRSCIHFCVIHTDDNHVRKAIPNLPLCRKVCGAAHAHRP